MTFSLLLLLLPDSCGLGMHQECRGRFPPHRLQMKTQVSDPGMHLVTSVTHVPWCMSESLTRGGAENITDIPGAILCIWKEAHTTKDLAGLKNCVGYTHRCEIRLSRLDKRWFLITPPAFTRFRNKMMLVYTARISIHMHIKCGMWRESKMEKIKILNGRILK